MKLWSYWIQATRKIIEHRSAGEFVPGDRSIGEIAGLRQQSPIFPTELSLLTVPSPDF
jgi:hypothetical protein